MNTGCWKILLLLVGLTPLASAQTSPLVDNAYHPGYVAYALPLDWLVRPDLRLACDALKHNNLTVAEKAFRTEIGQHPDDFGSYVGLLQATRGVRDTYLTDYQQDVKNEDTAANEFKLGLLAWYMFGERMPDNRPEAQQDKNRLAKLAQNSLKRAYALSHSRVVGFVLADADILVGTRTAIAVYEDMLKRMAGADVYNTYLQA